MHDSMRDGSGKVTGAMKRSGAVVVQTTSQKNGSHPGKKPMPSPKSLVNRPIDDKNVGPKTVVAQAPSKKSKVKPSKPAIKASILKPRSQEPATNLIVPRVAAVPTDNKPRKNMAGISPRELEVFRDMVLAKRREMVGDVSSMEHEALRSSGSNLSNLPLHMADMGTDNYEQEFTLGLMEKDRKLIRDLNDALAKIQDGTYGLCEGTGKPISRARLEAQPWARYSIEYARKLEGGRR